MTESVSESGTRRTCPVCDGTKLSAPFEQIEAVCETCGFVVHDWSESSVPREATITDGRQDNDQHESWSDVRPAVNSTEHRISSAIETIETVSNALSVEPSDRVDAAELYTSAAIEGVTDGRTIDSVAAAALCLSGRLAGCPRPPKRIADVIDIETSELNKILRTIQQEMSDKIGSTDIIPTPDDYLGFLTTDLNLNESVAEVATVLLSEIGGDIPTGGKNPAGVAAAAIYLAADDPPSQRDIAAAAGVATDTVRLRLREFQSEGAESHV
jgi:transcription initiation factor TFIIB